jgi:hypothetical protein
VGGFVLTVLFLTAILAIYGLGRMDRFEIAAISIAWLVLLINGVLLDFLFGRRQEAG